MNVLCESSDKVAAENYLRLSSDRMFHRLYQCELRQKSVRDKIDIEICACMSGCSKETVRRGCCRCRCSLLEQCDLAISLRGDL
jgi:hypothetical protein